MKKIILLSAFLFSYSLHSNAQYFNPFDSTKNEIGFSVVPFLTMVGFEINNPELIIQYKRHFTNKSFRLGIFLGNSEGKNPDLPENVVNLKDTQVVFHAYNDYAEYEGLKIGMEGFRKVASNWRFYYGADLLLGYKSVDTYDDQVVYKQNPDSSYTRKYEKPEFMKNTNYFRVGISPVAGFEYFFTPGLSSAFQATIAGFYEQELTKNHPNSSINLDTYFSLMLNFHFTRK